MTYCFTDQEMTRLRKAMDRAPSVLNQRPWDLRHATDDQGRVVYDRVEVYSAPDDDLGRLLPREVVISCGAALYNLRLALRVAGRDPSVWLLPERRGHGRSRTPAPGASLARERAMVALAGCVLALVTVPGRPRPAAGRSAGKLSETASSVTRRTASSGHNGLGHRRRRP